MASPNIYDEAHTAMKLLESLIQRASETNSPTPGTKERVQAITNTIWGLSKELSTLIHPLRSPSPSDSELESMLAAEQPESIQTPPKECRRILEPGRLGTWLASVQDKEFTRRRHTKRQSAAGNGQYRIEKQTRAVGGYMTRSKTINSRVLKTQ
ncbi:hypothetical protein DL95DRAFT_470915 [Leptodontidium sp. 2 PMI_412]|nr:hypothetical protein DL95DRAFT_470915 [Leptodontidium sp. 2 PMI_412]